ANRCLAEDALRSIGDNGPGRLDAKARTSVTVVRGHEVQAQLTVDRGRQARLAVSEVCDRPQLVAVASVDLVIEVGVVRLRDRWILAATHGALPPRAILAEVVLARRLDDGIAQPLGQCQPLAQLDRLGASIAKVQGEQNVALEAE